MTIFEEIAHRLREEFRNAPAGTALPSGPQLVAQYGCSRTTTNCARALLMREGWLAAEPGRGTFVVGPGGDQGVRDMKSERAYAALKAEIAAMPNGTRLAPRSQLAAKYGCSVSTMRRVLLRLKDDAYLHREGRKWLAWNP